MPQPEATEATAPFFDNPDMAMNVVESATAIPYADRFDKRAPTTKEIAG
jgi:hypothetical protein